MNVLALAYIVNTAGALPLAPAHKHTCCLAQGDRASAAQHEQPV